MKKLLILTLLLGACGSSPPSHNIPADAFQTINVYFTREPGGASANDCSSVTPLERAVPKIKDIETVALKNLFRGPSEDEKKAGYSSFFSPDTADMLIDFHGKEDTAYVNLTDIRAVIPNASSSCGSAELLAEMDATIKQFGNYSNTLYAIDGSSPDFYEWLQLSAPASFPDEF